MTDHQFAIIWEDALKCQDRDAWISDWCLSSVWGDEPFSEIPTDRIQQLEQIWIVAHISVRELVAQSHMTQLEFAERYCIPKRTVEDWCRGLRNPPDYIRLALARLMGMLA